MTGPGLEEDAASPRWLALLRAGRAREVPDGAWRALTQGLWPGARFSTSQPIAGGLSTLLDRITAVKTDGEPVTAVVRRFQPERGHGPEDAAGEVATLAVLAAHEAPAPRLLWSDPSGEVFGQPALAMSDLPGQPVAASLDARGAALAGRLLAQLHRIPGTSMEHVPDPGTLETQVTAILSGSAPADDDMLDRSGLHAAIEHGVRMVSGQDQTFLHDDFHPGNVMRHGDTAAVIDVTWSGRGDPGRDLGYCRLDLALTAVEGTVDAFLAGYRQAGGVVPEDLWFYDLLGGLRCLPTPAHWLPAFHAQGRTDLTTHQVEARARRFIADALERLEAR
ncbi:MAG: aminoglycoside phosphotransferase family protein [Nitriliruptorales bacterium]|nr:aminoglycoside phosphotransferase family protein [Nitriliruptorales bacterium]